MKEHHIKREAGFAFHLLWNSVISPHAQMDRNNLGWSIVDADRFLFFQLLDQSAHLRFEAVEGLTCVGNTCNVGRDDGGKGQYTPDYSIVLRALTNSVVANNVMHQGALKKLIVDLGGHGEGFV